MIAAFQLGNLTVDPMARLVRKDEAPLHLTPKQFDLLLYLLHRSGGIATREELLQGVWPDVEIEESNLTQNIFTLRKALGDAPDGSPYIETIPKHGYRLGVPVRTNHQHDRRNIIVRRVGFTLAILLWGLGCYLLGKLL